jgi:hypothetical protein
MGKPTPLVFTRHTTTQRHGNKQYKEVGFEVITAVVMKISVV